MLGPRIDRLTVPTLMIVEKATELAEQLTKDEDSNGWSFKVRHVGEKAVVDVYDEEGIQVGTF